MRLNENALNLPANAMGFRVFFALGSHLPCAHTGRIIILTCRFLVFHSCDNMVHFRVSLHNMYYQNYR